MNHYMYEQQAKSKLDARFKEGREWRKWRIAHPAGPGIVARMISFVRSTASRVQIALRGKTASVVEKQPTPALEPTLDTAYSTRSH